MRAPIAISLPDFSENFENKPTPSKQYHYTFWRDNDILVGEKWHEEIQHALGRCDVGLVLVSPAFLGSQYIQDHELPEFVKGGDKPVIPVMLQPIDLERHDLKGLQQSANLPAGSPAFRLTESLWRMFGVPSRSICVGIVSAGRGPFG